MFVRFLCFCLENSTAWGFFLEDLHQIVARGRASSRESPSTITGGLIKDVLP